VFKNLLHEVTQYETTRALRCGELSLEELTERVLTILTNPGSLIEGFELKESLVRSFNRSSREIAKWFYAFLRDCKARTSEEITALPRSAPIHRLGSALLAAGVDADRLNLGIYTARVLAQVEPTGGEYALSSGLAAQLYDTEIQGLRCDDLRLPYLGVFIACPSLPSELTTMSGDPAVLNGIAVQEHNRIWHVVGDLEAEDRTTFVSASFDLVNSDALVDSLVPRGLPPGATMDTRIRRLLSFLTNVVVYMTWPDAEVDHVFISPHTRKLWEKIEKTPPSKRRQRLEALFRSMDQSRTYLLGRSVIYLSRQQTMAKDGVEGETGAKLLAYQRIPGHWKNQPCGPHWSLRKRIHIEPYWRGPEYGVLSEPVHKLVGGAHG
jgi:hypothetical protein